MKMRRAIPALSGGTAAALVMMGAAPALASPARGAHSRSTSITSILQAGNTVTGVRGTGGGGVVLTGLAAVSGSQAAFLFRGRLGAAAGAAVSVLHPAFRKVTSAPFYGPDTHLFNPRAVRNHFYGQPLCVADGLFAGCAVGHHAREFQRFGYPATIVFAVQFDGKVHICDSTADGSAPGDPPHLTTLA